MQFSDNTTKKQNESKRAQSVFTELQTTYHQLFHISEMDG
jgi:hypothetical protein